MTCCLNNLREALFFIPGKSVNTPKSLASIYLENKKKTSRYTYTKYKDDLGFD